ncbi:MAG TPA: pyruvate ferredoxin oxidoreductase [Aciduliprofundum sp.]|nr:pyruvate ferredoxin oxidoreductase [Aciduliprofundum sp.]
MIEIRFHGRGGQGAVVASKLLARAVVEEGKYAVTFPMYGVERRGAPVAAFLRVDERPIRLKTLIYEPDIVVVLDPALLALVNVFEGLKEGGSVIINYGGDPSRLPVDRGKYRHFVVDATGIALDLGLGSRTNPIVNTAMLGAFAGATRLVSLETLERVVREGAPAKKEENAMAVRRAFESVREVT